MRRYTPRRASVKRWLEGAPDYILDILDNGGKTADRYTILFGGDFIFHTHDDGRILTGGDEYRNTYVQYLAMGEGGRDVSLWCEMPAWDAANYRYRCKHHRVRWDSLSAETQAHIIARATEGDDDE